jgi:hypothetical protein
MSVKVMDRVFKYGPSDRADFSVLLSLANHGNDAGGECWPSAKTIATEMRMGERSVLRSLARLREEGWISVTRWSRNGKGSSYQLNLDKLTSHAKLAGDKGATSPATVAGDKGSHTKLAGDVANTVTVTAKSSEGTCQIEQSHLPNTTESPAKNANALYEPSFEPSLEPSCAQAPRGLVAQSSKKPELRAGVDGPSRESGTVLMAKLHAWLQLHWPGKKPLASLTEEKLSELFANWDELEQHVIEKTRDWKREPEPDGPLMAEARSWLRRYAPKSTILDSMTEATLAAIGDSDEVIRWLNERHGEPVYMPRVAKAASG